MKRGWAGLDYNIDVMGRYKLDDDEYDTTMVRKLKLSVYMGDEMKEHMDGDNVGSW